MKKHFIYWGIIFFLLILNFIQLIFDKPKVFKTKKLFESSKNQIGRYQYFSFGDELFGFLDTQEGFVLLRQGEKSDAWDLKTELAHQFTLDIYSERMAVLKSLKEAGLPLKDTVESYEIFENLFRSQKQRIWK